MLAVELRQHLDARVALEDQLAQHLGPVTALAVEVLQGDFRVTHLEHEPSALPVAAYLTLLEKPAFLESASHPS